jgi:CheY-like chemotaxis protein
MGITGTDHMGFASAFDSEIEEATRILLVDDDPTFGVVMSRAAEQLRAHITYCKSLEEVKRVAGWNFDVAIVDYDLGSSTGVEVARFLQSHPKKIPVIIVSQSQRVDTPISDWPEVVKGFMQKGLGHFALLEAAFAARDSKGI